MYTLTLNLTISLGLSGVVTQKGLSWVCIIPFPHFRLRSISFFEGHGSSQYTHSHPQPHREEEEQGEQPYC